MLSMVLVPYTPTFRGKERGCSIFFKIVQGVQVRNLPIHVFFLCELNMFHSNNPNGQ
jgi:hypothetical protein